MVAMFENFISVTQEEDVPQVGLTLVKTFNELHLFSASLAPFTAPQQQSFIHTLMGAAALQGAATPLGFILGCFVQGDNSRLAGERDLNCQAFCYPFTYFYLLDNFFWSRTKYRTF